MKKYQTLSLPTNRRLPYNGSYFVKGQFYYATISLSNQNSKPKLYKGSCKESFKKCCGNHKKLFIIPFYKHDTKLPTECWNFKMKQLNAQISWKIKGIYKSYNPISKCNRCLKEKLEALKDLDKNQFNKGSEIISQYHHNYK